MAIDRESLQPRRIKVDDIVFFANQLAVMVDTGVPLSEALDSIANSTDHDGVAIMVDDLSEKVKGGTEFSEALEAYPKLFNEQFVSMIRASEASGTMGMMLQRSAQYMMQDRETRKQVKGAMVYPISMLSFCVVVVVMLLAFVMPRFEKIYAGKGKALPVPTQVLMSISGVITGYWMILLIGLGAVVGGLVAFLRTPTGRQSMDWVKINMPMFGGMYRKGCIARSLRTMSTMIDTGVSMLEGLEITSRVAGNYYFSKLWTGLAEDVSEGSALSTGLYESPLIPRTITQMVEAGERSGRLAEVTDRVAAFCEDDLKIAIKTLTSMIEPVMIIVMGAVIGGIAMALLLPIFTMSKVMKPG
jgi:type IV pilus assembly protein PilC